jgi:hypothetical protein
LVFTSRGSLYGGGGAGGSGVNSYIDLENRPDDIIDTTVIPAGTTGGEFTPNNDNTNKALVKGVIFDSSSSSLNR